jgi:hypothetical protein
LNLPEKIQVTEFGIRLSAGNGAEEMRSAAGGKKVRVCFFFCCEKVDIFSDCFLTICSVTQ